MQSLFHFAYHVRDLASARRFYCDVLGCAEGRSTETWLDIDFFGHQLSLHLGEPFAVSNTGKVGDHWVPMPHFGVVLGMPDWLALKERLMERDVDFVLAPPPQPPPPHLPLLSRARRCPSSLSPPAPFAFHVPHPRPRPRRHRADTPHAGSTRAAHHSPPAPLGCAPAPDLVEGWWL